MPRKPVTIGYIPLIHGKPGRFSGTSTDGQICYCGGGRFPVKIERSRSVVRHQIALTKRNRAAWGFMDSPSDKYTIERIVY